MKKNQLFVVFGGKVEEDDYYNVTYLEYFREARYYKNKEKAEDYVELLIDDYMKMKSYSQNYEIIDWWGNQFIMVHLQTLINLILLTWENENEHKHMVGDIM